MKYRSFLFVLFLSLISTTLPAQGQDHLLVMSYNIRFDNPGDGQNAWPRRKAFVADQIAYYRPDLIGVQEALLHQLSYLDSILTEYAYVGVGRDDGAQAGEFSAILYRKDRFEIEEKGTFWLSTTPTQPSTGWDAALPRICTFVKVRARDGSRSFWHFNTHYDHVGEEARRKSGTVILEQVRRRTSEDDLVLLSGDFNARPQTDPIRVIKGSFQDSYQLASRPQLGPDATFNGFRFGEAPVPGRIDYVFLKGTGFRVIRHGVLTDHKDQRYPSDHFPVLVELELD